MQLEEPKIKTAKEQKEDYRAKHGLFSASELARAWGICPKAILNGVMRNYYSPPDVKLSWTKRRFYSREQAAMLKKELIDMCELE